MRISTDKTDPGYRPDAYIHTVFLNNERMVDCYTADEEKGEVLVARKSLPGERPDQKEWLYGKVRIVIEGGAG